MKPRINLYLATSTSCNVRCKSCPTGRKEFQPGGVMSLEMLRRILDKAQAEAHVITVQLYHYGEPGLVPNMNLMIRECHVRKMPVFFSTNLVVWKNIPGILAESPESFLISLSGFTQPTYERSHKGGDVEKVKENMRMVAVLRKPSTDVQVSYHHYKYNEQEIEPMRKYSESLGFRFVPYGCSLIEQEALMRVFETGIDHPGAEDLLVPVKVAQRMCQKRKHWDCLLQQQIVAVNGEGNVLLCSNLTGEPGLRGSFFDRTVADFMKARYQDPTCKRCRELGAHVYAMQAYTRSNWSPIRLAETAYRRLHLQGRWPAFSRFFTKIYWRPQVKETL